MITAKERDKYIEEVRAAKYNKVVPIRGKRYNPTDYAWLELAYYSFTNIRRKLDQIENFEFKDHFEILKHPDTPLFLRDYLKHYDNDNLLFLKRKIRQAQKGLDYLTGSIDAEISRRNIKEGGKHDN